MNLNPSLALNGYAEEALTLYREALGGQVEITRFAGSPAAGAVPPDWGSKVLYGALTSPLGVVAVMDCTPERGGQPGGNVTININVTSTAQAEHVFTKLSSGGEVTMPLEQTFWAERFGMLVDKFGTKWMVNYAKD